MTQGKLPRKGLTKRFVKMKFGNYRIDAIFLMLAVVFLIMMATTQNFAFIGAVMICVIFGIKKIKDTPKNTHQK